MPAADIQEGQDLLDFFAPVLGKISDPSQRDRAQEVLTWVHTTYPQLTARIGWNQPMFTHRGTYIIGFSYAKAHMAVAPEATGIQHFASAFDQQGISYTAQLFRLPWSKLLPYQLLGEVIDFNITEKEGLTSFWRP
ncbi:iron chaperone [Rothia nasimurium]|uniref:iron chaperone n=1 Tax=Rothia nasimurium TaxID=85336 RepID=UPI002DD6B08F|nr:DUF1801 domain-containing protein [Rothia nasimurium]